MDLKDLIHNKGKVRAQGEGGEEAGKGIAQGRGQAQGCVIGACSQIEVLAFLGSSMAVSSLLFLFGLMPASSVLPI